MRNEAVRSIFASQHTPAYGVGTTSPIFGQCLLSHIKACIQDLTYMQSTNIYVSHLQSTIVRSFLTLIKTTYQPIGEYIIIIIIIIVIINNNNNNNDNIKTCDQQPQKLPLIFFANHFLLSSTD